MAVFGAPVAMEDHAVRACLVALGIQEQANRLAAEVQDRDGADLRSRVGLNSAQVIAGDVGSTSLGYTTIGKQVGMAQRMESVAPPGGRCSASPPRTWSSERARYGVSTSWRISRVPINGSRPVACSAWGNGLVLARVLSRVLSVGGGRCPPLKGCGTVRSTTTARVVAVVGPPASARAVWCARLRRWRADGAWRIHRLLRVARQPGPLPCRRETAARGQRH